LAPLFLACEKPMAIACWRLITFWPLLPLLSSPRSNLLTASSIDSCVIWSYFGIYVVSELVSSLVEFDVRGAALVRREKVDPG